MTVPPPHRTRPSLTVPLSFTTVAAAAAALVDVAGPSAVSVRFSPSENNRGYWLKMPKPRETDARVRQLLIGPNGRFSAINSREFSLVAAILFNQ